MIKFIRTEMFWETFRYVVCGVVTVLINVISYKLLSNILDTLLSNTIAFFIAVFFAFLGNSVFVFHVKCTWKSFLEFMGMRIGTLLIDNGGMLLMILSGINDLIAKIVVNIIIIIINYIFSKFFIFNKKEVRKNR